MDDTLAPHLKLIARHKLGALVTLKRDGRPQLSNVIYAYDPDLRVARVSVTESRAKTQNLRRDPRAGLYVSSADGWNYAVAEGDAELTPVASSPEDDTVDDLVDLYRRLSGEHPDWDEYRAAMVAEQRLVVWLWVTHAYGMAP